MNFSTNSYLIFFIIACLVKITFKDKGSRNGLAVLQLFALSCLFFGISSWMGLCVLAVIGVADFYLGIISSKSNHKSDLFIYISLCLNLSILMLFKYGYFVLNLFPVVIKKMIDINLLSAIQVGILPGISFFIFQSMSYSIDVYRKKIPAEQSLLRYLFFLSFFPQLIAGPIVKAKDFLNQIDGMFTRDLEFRRIFFYFLSGILKKSVLSDGIAPIVDTLFNYPGHFSGPALVLGMLGFSCQIYLDFSGYSDFARASALFFGIELPENFLFPYSSSSFSEFWRRWHISLSDWLKNYLYFSMGGNRQGEYRTYFNLIITMLIGGLWHGPSWNYVFWGLGHGLLLAMERFFGWNTELDLGRLAGRFLSFIRAGFIFLAVSFLWIPFRSRDFTSSFEFLSRIFMWDPGFNLSYSEENRLYFVIFSVLFFSFFGRNYYEKVEIWLKEKVNFSDVFLIPVLFIVLVLLSSGGMRPFIYFVF